MKTRIFLAAAGLLLFSLRADAQDRSNPRDEMTRIIDKLVVIAEANTGDENLEKRKREMRTVIEPEFDFRQMSQLSLGAQWPKITPAEQDEFVNVFSDLLAKTYLNRICNIRRGMVKITGDRVREQKALVKTMVTYKSDEFPLDYKLVYRSGAWKVYDVIIENIGLVVNYRNEFAGIMRRERFAGLMARLKDKLAAPDKEAEPKK